MFDFRNGMLGVVVVAVAIGAALFASYFAGIESVEHDVVKYNELADVTGLFDTETSPQYVDYDPSSNYTGYYSEQSYSEITEKYYFAEDQVYYHPNVDQYGNPRVNNYKVNLIPIDNGNYRVNLSDIPGLEQTDDRYMIFYHPTSVNTAWTWGTAKAYTLSSLIENIVGGSTNTINIHTRDADWSQTDLDVPLIIPTSWFGNEGTSHAVVMYNPNVDPSNIETVFQKHAPYQSFSIDVTTNTVTAYTDANYSEGATQYRLDSMLLFWGDDPEQLGLRHLNLSEYISYHSYNIRTDYLDPNYGVSLKDELPAETISAVELRSYAGGTYQITAPILEIISDRSGDSYYVASPKTVHVYSGQTEQVKIYKITDGEWFHTYVTVTIERVSP